MQDLPIDTLLDDLGYGTPELRAAARTALEAGGLTRPGKQRIAEAKREPARAALAAAVLAACADCAPAAAAEAPERHVVVVEREHCAICGGSSNERAIAALEAACAEAGVRRVVVVGGSPGTRADLRGRIRGLELRLVDGVSRRTLKQARDDLAWADLVVVWGATEIDHKTSALYTGANVVTCQRRGVTSLVETVLTRLRPPLRSRAR
jgi:hypothetical protein